ncbi:orotidine 5'-phosphate decarboxylase [Sedimentisphaera cyanobacteriorum]|uniref:Orotidine-5'-phosphate decarboxylase n=1 Tax=Sedimentisphaera cyanobacteriorum TaxID=1940790 RepID=A0A1Q2HMQ5_9BACT|nr:orotidine-5'-phosphate decarboxylase [Sedimentisphaera cyanobacteriorum]AQQ08819.1 orotidine 5'-phosphate decarboxylase [Sedimentisphaera cyanobacteriorum]
MAKHFGDALYNAVLDKDSILCVGLDPVYGRLPEDIKKRYGNSANNIDSVIDATIEFCTRTLKVISEHVPAVKLNSAYFEKYYWDGIEAYYSLITEAESLGVQVIGDVKRGDIGHTCTAYADAHIKEPKFKSLNVVSPNAVTINGFAGADGIIPFADAANDSGSGIFVWVRASNPSAARLQDALTEEGVPFYQILSEITAEIADQPKRIGESGYSNVGMVIGGTTPEHTSSLRMKYPNVWFLVPGFGSQGGQPSDCIRFCKPDKTGALINSSRGIIYAYEKPEYKDKFGDDWESCIEQAVIDANDSLNQAMQF